VVGPLIINVVMFWAIATSATYTHKHTDVQTQRYRHRLLPGYTFMTTGHSCSVRDPSLTLTQFYMRVW